MSGRAKAHGRATALLPGRLLALILLAFHLEVIFPLYFMQMAGVLLSAVIPMP